MRLVAAVAEVLAAAGAAEAIGSVPSASQTQSASPRREGSGTVAEALSALLQPPLLATGAGPAAVGMDSSRLALLLSEALAAAAVAEAARPAAATAPASTMPSGSEDEPRGTVLPSVRIDIGSRWLVAAIRRCRRRQVRAAFGSIVLASCGRACGWPSSRGRSSWAAARDPSCCTALAQPPSAATAAATMKQQVPTVLRSSGCAAAPRPRRHGITAAPAEKGQVGEARFSPRHRELPRRPASAAVERRVAAPRSAAMPVPQVSGVRPRAVSGGRRGSPAPPQQLAPALAANTPALAVAARAAAAAATPRSVPCSVAEVADMAARVAAVVASPRAPLCNTGVVASAQLSGLAEAPNRSRFADAALWQVPMWRTGFGG